MQALGSKVLFEYSYLAARDIPIPIAQAVFYMHLGGSVQKISFFVHYPLMHPFCALVKLAK